MTDTAVQPKIPSEGWLRVQRKLCTILMVTSFFVYTYGLMVFFGHLDGGPRMVAGSSWLSWLVPVSIGAIFVCYRFREKVDRKRNQLYLTVVDGNVTEKPAPIRVDGGYRFRVVVQGVNGAGQPLLKEVPVSFDGWNSISVGDDWPGKIWP